MIATSYVIARFSLTGTDTKASGIFHVNLAVASERSSAVGARVGCGSPCATRGIEWLCKAEASFGNAIGGGSWDYSRELQLGSGKTREEAANQALSNCNEIMSERESVATLGGDRVDAGTCEITQCMPPGSPLR